MELNLRDDVEVFVLDAVVPTAVAVGARTVGIPGVTEVDTLAEPLVHGAALGVVDSDGMNFIIVDLGCSFFCYGRLASAIAGKEKSAQGKGQKFSQFHGIPRVLFPFTNIHKNNYT